jgi:hypothetical protein
MLINLIKTTEETTMIEKSLNSLQEIINEAGDKLRYSIFKYILTTVKSLFSKQERSTRLEAGRCMDSLVRHLQAEDLQALLREASVYSISIGFMHEAQHFWHLMLAVR